MRGPRRVVSFLRLSGARGPFRKGLFKRVVRFRFVFVVWKICYGNRKVTAYENRIENKPTTKKI